MLERRSTIDRYAADLEMAQMVFNKLSNVQGASEQQVCRAAVQAKRVELKLSGAKLAQAEYYLDTLKARLDFLEARSAGGCATKTEETELAWARQAVPINSATVARLATEAEQRKVELEELLKQAQLIEDGSRF